jgi:hypothetical protein
MHEPCLRQWGMGRWRNLGFSPGGQQSQRVRDGHLKAFSMLNQTAALSQQNAILWSADNVCLRRYSKPACRKFKIKTFADKDNSFDAVAKKRAKYSLRIAAETLAKLLECHWKNYGKSDLEVIHLRSQRGDRTEMGFTKRQGMTTPPL